LFAVIASSNAIARVDVFAATLGSGVAQTNITYAGLGGGLGWLSLDQLVYSVAPKTNATFVNGYVNYGGVFEGAGYASDNGAVYLTGLVSHTAFPKGKPIFTLPADMAPSSREVFTSLAANQAARVDVLTTGDVILMSTVATSGWVSLSNVHFRTADAVFSNLTLSSGWVTYTGYSPLQANLGSDGRVYVRGLVKSGKAAAIGTLPTTMRPTLQRLFVTQCSSGTCRVDVTTAGVISLSGKTYGVTTGTTAWPSWISLSGISFDPTVDTAGY